MSRPEPADILKTAIPDAVDETEARQAETLIEDKPVPDNDADKQKGVPAETGRYSRRNRRRHPIILLLAFAVFLGTVNLSAQLSYFVEMGATYTDNAFQLSSFDLERNEDGHPDLEFVKSADDVILKTMLYGTYRTHYRWWQIRPLLQFNASQYILNPAKQRVDILAGLKVSRRLGELGIYYGYTPEYYVREYIDHNGTDRFEDYSYEKNLYRADLRLRPLPKSTASLEYRLDQYYYNQYFTEYDGDITTWKLGWEQSFPIFYLNASYAYKVYETDRSQDLDTPEDASYESNVYAAGILLKKMDLDPRYPRIQWRPELNLTFETRYYQGGDNWHAGRTDNLNTTAATLHLYLGDRWNFKLDYTQLFRNVDAPYASVMKYKEFNESRLGVSARYNF
jgi:predicted DNA-binding protein